MTGNPLPDGLKDAADPKTVEEPESAAHATKALVRVERVTALRGQAIAKPPAILKKQRRNAEHELLADSDIPYEEFEKALSRVLCSLVERQDRASEALLLRLNDLQYRMDDAEYELRELAEKDKPAGKRKG